MKSLMIAAAAAVSMIAPQAMAAQIFSAASLPGNQSYSDNLGLDFNVNAGGVTIMSLGAFDAGNNGITANVTVGIWDLVNNSWAVAPISFIGQTAASGNAYALLSLATPVWLAPGSYSVVARGFNGANPNFNTNISGQNNASPIAFNDLGGALTNVGSRYGGPANNPEGAGSVIFAPKSAFAGGTFIAAVPEPGTWAMMIGGFGLVGFSMRRRRKTDIAFA